MSKKRKAKRVEYSVDFESWYIEADNSDDATEQAYALLLKGNAPDIVSVGPKDW